MSRIPAGTLVLGRRAQAREGLTDQARDLHLRHADAGADLGLCQVLAEAQLEHAPLAGRDGVEERLEGGAMFGEVETALLGPEALGQRLARLVVLASTWALQRSGPVGARRLQRLEHLLVRGVDRLRDLGDGGRAVQIERELGHGAIDAERELLQVAGDSHGPRAVTEVTLELAEDGGNRVAREHHLALRVEAIDCLQEAERGHLHEVVEGLVRALIAASQLAREGKEAFDQLLAGPLVAVAQQALEKLVLGLTPDLRSRA